MNQLHKRPIIRPRSFTSIYWVVILVVALDLGARAQTLTVITVDGHATTLSAAQIDGAPHATLSVDDHGTPAKFDGVPLATILGMAGIPLGDAMRGARMAEILLVTASDGYKVAFALAELDPAFAERQIILADKRDGKALDAREGPFRIVAPGDKRPARWIRQVIELRVVTAR